MKLTGREIEVLKLKQEGFTQVEIAKKLNISQPAVSGFYNNALAKIKDSADNVKIAHKIGVKVQ